jgi:hypothetical protein
VKQKITLKEALCGWSSYLVHMDGRVLHLQTQPGDVIRPGPSKVIPGMYSCDRGTACKARTARERLQQRKKKREREMANSCGIQAKVCRFTGGRPARAVFFSTLRSSFPLPYVLEV